MPNSHGIEQEIPLEKSCDAPQDSLVARRRREEIVQAATEIIASEGLHRLSLARIEHRISMSRGQLTYYFPTKEAILLAVFDRMLTRMIEDSIADAAEKQLPQPGTGGAWECLKHCLSRNLDRDNYNAGKQQLLPLIHTFMAQVQHREDYRQKLAAANAGWRNHLAADFATSLSSNPAISPAVLASIVMALIQGLSDQLAVDPGVLDREQTLNACLFLLAPLFEHVSPRNEVRSNI